MTFSPLLAGTTDLHVHAGPSIMPRRFDALEVVRTAQAAGMSGVLLKDHYVPTQDIARLAQNELERQHGPGAMTVAGAVCLNASIGGFNPAAVEVGLKAGARMVFLPTVNAQHHEEMIEGKERGKLMPTPLLKRRENIAPPDGVDGWESWLEIADLIAEHDAVLSTGHMDRDSSLAFIASAYKRGARRFLVTHASLFEPLDRPFVEAIEPFGAFFEVTALPTLFPGFTLPEFGQPIQAVVRLLGELGPAQTVLSSDCGHPEGPHTVEAFGDYLELLSRSGIPARDLTTMAATNPTGLLRP